MRFLGLLTLVFAVGCGSDNSALVKRIEELEGQTKELGDTIAKLETAKAKGSMTAGDKAHFDALSCDVLKCKLIGVIDNNGKLRIAMTTEESGATTIHLAGSDQQERLSLMVFDDGRAILRGVDKTGKPRLVAGVGKNDAGSLVIFDGDGKPKHLLMAE